MAQGTSDPTLLTPLSCERQERKLRGGGVCASQASLTTWTRGAMGSALHMAGCRKHCDIRWLAPVLLTAQDSTLDILWVKRLLGPTWNIGTIYNTSWGKCALDFKQ